MNENPWGLQSKTTEEVDAELVASVDASHMKDYDGSRRKYATLVSTSEALRKRRMGILAKRNGHT